jgi:two-component system sensor histidine kinase UhpB
MIKAQEEARRSIARDLHDDVCQDLVAMSLAVCSLQRSSGSIQDPQTQTALTKLQQWALALVDSVRRLSHDLHPPTLGLLGLASALKAHCLELQKRHDVKVTLAVAGDLGPIHPDAAVCLFRIAQEALRNGISHGAAQRLAVSLARADDHIELTITDDGAGFDLDAVRRSGTGLGLVSIEERAHAVGGEVRIITKRKRGTRIHVRVPAGTPPARNAESAPAQPPEPVALERSGVA